MKMIRIALLVLACGGTSIIVSCSPPHIEVPPEDANLLTVGNNQFSLDLYRKIAEKQTGNILMSPYSISSALTMAYAGARGKTAEEMRTTLRFQLPDDRLHVAMGGTMQQLQSQPSGSRYELSIANSLWTQQGLGVKREFLSLTKSYYGGSFREVDFARNADGCRQTINQWVDDKTQHRIPELLTSQDVHSSTVLVLINTIYFKGQWVEPFGRTSNQDFEASADVKHTVPLMNVQKSFRYHKADNFEIVELPYQGDQVSMVVLLPNKRFGLAEVEKTLSQAKLQTAIALASKRSMSVSLPKFKTTFRIYLNEHLKEMGMPSAFQDDADFSGIVSGMTISKVIHSANIEVDEKGTVAAAATAISATFNGPAPPKPFRADQPFMYFLIDNQNSAILFCGRFNQP